MYRLIPIIMILCCLSCSRQQKDYVPLWDKGVEQPEVYDLRQIQMSGDLIALTISGPETYYEYHGKELGLHFLICKRFAHHLGVRLRMEVCRDTMELNKRLLSGDADLIAYPLQSDSLTLGWKMAEGKKDLKAAFENWYKPDYKKQLIAQEQWWLSQPRVHRHVFAPLLNSKTISNYDNLFRKYSRLCGWDWRLIAAQCYQESTFDPQAASWAGAKGLMQIMPSTADYLHLSRIDMLDPEKNIAAACKYIAELNNRFSDVKEYQERVKFVLAAYNGGHFHIRDAMRLAERDGLNSKRWSDVRKYVLKLSDPQYYRDSLVQNGYMRGSETVEYVDQIQLRYQKYRNVRK